MHRFVLPAVFGILLTSAAVRADLTNDFSTNPLTDPQVLIQGPDAANAATRFTYNAGAQSLTAHYDSTLPTIKLVFPLGQHLTQNDSFAFSSTFTIPTSGFVSPPYFSAQAPSFGLVNSVSTGTQRASTGFYDASIPDFVYVTQGNAYNIMTMDYFPGSDPSQGGNSVSLTAVKSQVSADFNSHFAFGFAGDTTLPFDQSITASMNYNAQTHHAILNYGSGEINLDLTGMAFDFDSFALTLWSDPNLNPPPPADAAGGRVAGDVVFDSFTVATPEPASLGILLSGAMALMLRRRR